MNIQKFVNTTDSFSYEKPSKYINLKTLQIFLQLFGHVRKLCDVPIQLRLLGNLYLPASNLQSDRWTTDETLACQYSPVDTLKSYLVVVSAFDTWSVNLSKIAFLKLRYCGLFRITCFHECFHDIFFIFFLQYRSFTFE